MDSVASDTLAETFTEPGPDTDTGTGAGTDTGAPEPVGEQPPDLLEDGAQPWQTDLGRAPVAVKIVVAGGFGAGKSTLVSAVSEVAPLRTEALMPEPVTMDFGRITLDDDLVLFLFGTPGHDRYWFLWDDLVRGAAGILVVADTERLADCFPALDYAESSGLPYAVAVNRFADAERHPTDAVRSALAVPAHVPVLDLDARRRISVVEALLALVRHARDAAPP